MIKNTIIITALLSQLACLPLATNQSETKDYGTGFDFSLPLDPSMLAKIGPAQALLRSTSRSFSSPLKQDPVTGGVKITFLTDDAGNDLVEGDSLYSLGLSIIRLSDGQVIMSGPASPSQIAKLAPGFNDSISVNLSCTQAAQGICGDVNNYQVVPAAVKTQKSNSFSNDFSSGVTPNGDFSATNKKSCSCGPVDNVCAIWDSSTLERVDSAQQIQYCDMNFCKAGFQLSTYEICDVENIIFVPQQGASTDDLNNEVLPDSGLPDDGLTTPANTGANNGLGGANSSGF